LQEFEEKQNPLIELPAIMNNMDTTGQLWNTPGIIGLDESKDKIKTIRVIFLFLQMEFIVDGYVMFPSHPSAI
jgi:hypothetical protein